MEKKRIFGIVNVILASTIGIFALMVLASFFFPDFGKTLLNFGREFVKILSPNIENYIAERIAISVIVCVGLLLILCMHIISFILILKENKGWEVGGAKVFLIFSLLAPLIAIFAILFIFSWGFYIPPKIFYISSIVFSILSIVLLGFTIMIILYDKKESKKIPRTSLITLFLIIFDVGWIILSIGLIVLVQLWIYQIPIVEVFSKFKGLF